MGGGGGGLNEVEYLYSNFFNFVSYLAGRVKEGGRKTRKFD